MLAALMRPPPVKNWGFLLDTIKVAVRWIVLAFVFIGGAVTFAGPGIGFVDWETSDAQQTSSQETQTPG